MTPTRTLSAVLVWLRASERISVTVLAIAECTRLGFEPGTLASRRINVINDEIIGPFG
jgi:hypothetical protein